MRGLVAGATVVVVLALVPVAHATQRFASPTGGAGPECPQATPCSLTKAVEGAKAGDEVIVGAGTYPVSATIPLPKNTTNVQVHGDTSGPIPRITGTLEAPLMEMYEAGDSISYLEIENDANNGFGVYCTAGRLERLRIRVVGSGGVGVYDFPDCGPIRNSLLLAEGLASTALRVGDFLFGTYVLAARNLTAIASGTGSSGATVEFVGVSAGSATLELQNSIVRGSEQDLKATGNPNGPATVAATHSNYVNFKPGVEGKLVDGGGNQTAAPLFVNAESGDYREAAGSPTIDAGLAGELGPLDLAGGARVQGSAPDIGAFEFTPPPAPANGRLEALSIKPSKFRAGNVPGAVASKKKRAPLGATVSYSLSAAATVEFHVERGGTGRKVGGKCVKQTHANKSKQKCVIYKPLKGRFSLHGAAGANSFKFSGKVGGKALKPGPYRLVGSAGNAIRRASFKIVK